MISGSGSFGTINIILVYVLVFLFFFVFIDVIFQRSPFIVSNKYNLLFLNMMSGSVQTHIEAAHTKRLYIEDTESICYKNKFIEKKPKYNIVSVYPGQGIISLTLDTRSIKTEWIDVSV